MLFARVLTRIAVHAESTLSKPISVTITSGGHTFTSAPAFVTTVFTSTASNGLAVTASSIFANPTSLSDSSAIDHWESVFFLALLPLSFAYQTISFFDNHGAVAGIFVGVALALLGSIITFFFCRRRRRRLAASQGSRRTDERSVNDAARPDMSIAIADSASGRYVDRFGLSIATDHPRRHLTSPSISSNGHTSPTQPPSLQLSHHSSDVHGSGQAGIGTLGLRGMGVRNEDVIVSVPYDGPFSDYHRYIPAPPPRETFGIAISNDEMTSKPRAPSPTPSTPSIYPPSLPPVAEQEDAPFYEQEIKRVRPSRRPVPSPIITDDFTMASQDPFVSPLDKAYEAEGISQPIKTQAGDVYTPSTPPDSLLGHSPVTSPTSSQSSSGGFDAKVNPFANGFLGRSVSVKEPPIPRPMRSPLRTSGSVIVKRTVT